jgi:multidrug resistance efflux pump
MNPENTTLPTPAAAKTRRRSILTPVAYSEALMPSLQLARSSRIARRIAAALLLLLTATMCLMGFAPWQQTITGEGYVIAYAPRERQQVLEATIEGRIFRWNEDLVENVRVAKGDFIAEIRDLDESYTMRLQGQLENTSAILEASRKIVEASEGQLQAYRRVQTEIEQAQNAYVQSATEKVTAAEQKLAIAEAAIPQLEAAFNRAKDLHAAGNIALEKLQEIERKLLESQGKVKEETANVSASRAELLGKRSDREAYIHKAAADVQYYEGALDKAKSEVSKAEKEKLDMQSKVARQSTQEIIAPFDGYLVHLSANIGSQMVKKGDPICTIVRSRSGWTATTRRWSKRDATCDCSSKAGRQFSLPAGHQWRSERSAAQSYRSTWSITARENFAVRFFPISPSATNGPKIASCGRAYAPTAGCCWNKCRCGSKSGENSMASRPRWMSNRRRMSPRRRPIPEASEARGTNRWK